MGIFFELLGQYVELLAGQSDHVEMEPLEMGGIPFTRWGHYPYEVGHSPYEVGVKRPAKLSSFTSFYILLQACMG